VLSAKAGIQFVLFCATMLDIEMFGGPKEAVGLTARLSFGES